MAPDDTAHANTEEFPCESCGATLHFAPGTHKLRCPYCDHAQHIAPTGETVQDYDFEEGRKAARRMRARDLTRDGMEWRCTGCGAVSVTDKQAVSCAFCDSPVVIESGPDEVFVPESLLPFHVDRREAKGNFDRWLDKLWFAPNDLVAKARSESIDGAYLPYWTYDANTTARYSGKRGDDYYVTKTYRDKEGNRRTKQVRKTRWRRRSGVVHDTHDDVLICASRSLPDRLIHGLEPWDLHDLTPYDARFLSGFIAERYAIDLEEGFVRAKQRIEPEVRSSVKRDIGGDRQKINRMSVRYDDVRFKHFLLPLWISSFRYEGEVYRFLVNARTGEIAGERPWSVPKIVAAVVAGVFLVVGIVLLKQWLDGR